MIENDMSPEEPNPFESPRTRAMADDRTSRDRRTWRIVAIVLAVLLIPPAAIIAGFCCCLAVGSATNSYNLALITWLVTAIALGIVLTVLFRRWLLSRLN